MLLRFIGWGWGSLVNIGMVTIVTLGIPHPCVLCWRTVSIYLLSKALITTWFYFKWLYIQRNILIGYNCLLKEGRLVRVCEKSSDFCLLCLREYESSHRWGTRQSLLRWECTGLISHPSLQGLLFSSPGNKDIANGFWWLTWHRCDYALSIYRVLDSVAVRISHAILKWRVR